MDETERMKWLARKYLDRTLDAKEAEEFFQWLDKVNNPDIADVAFREEWLHGNRTYKIEGLPWERIQQLGEVKKEQKKTRIISLPLAKWVAASLAILIAVSIWWMMPGNVYAVVYETGYGETLKIELNDGTHVVLNANSRLTWNKDWEKMDEGRYAQLEGEAYFDVSRICDNDESKRNCVSFRVRTSDLLVNVLGTTFNVSNRRGKTDVFLESGLVKLDLSASDSIKGERRRNDKDNPVATFDSVFMKPGELVSFSSKSGELQRVNRELIKHQTDWKEGALTFNKMQFGTILSSLEDLYGKQFEVKDSTLLSRTVSLALPYENWSTVRQLIEITMDIDFIEYEQNNIVRIGKRSGN